MRNISRHLSLIASALLSIIVSSAQAEVKVNLPRLVVTISVDNLRTDYLNALQKLFGTKGLNRLMGEGVYYTDMEYDYPSTDAVTAMATLYTGSYPSHHGVISSRLYNNDSKRPELILSHPEMLGNYSTLTLSPRGLLASTFTDQLKLASDWRSLIYSISPNAQQAIIASGHIGNTPFWLDDMTGKWATTTYYREMPQAIAAVNDMSPVVQRADTLLWTPSRSPEVYLTLPGQKHDKSFKYGVSKGKENKIVNLKNTPLVNREITDLSLLLLKSTPLGKRDVPDVLNVNYTLDNKRYNPSSLLTAETQDAYLRLDEEIATLLETIDKEVGLQHTLVVLTSTGYRTRETLAASDDRLPGGTFYPNRATSLLNMYLMALHGNGNWVLGYCDDEIYLNRKLITEKGLELSKIAEQSAQFLMEMTGVQDAITLNDVLHNPRTERIEAIRRGVHRKLSGDLLLYIEPGREIDYEDNRTPKEYRIGTAIPLPLIVWYKGGTATRITRPVQAVSLAPSLTQLLRIRPPNASVDLPLPEILW